MAKVERIEDDMIVDTKLTKTEAIDFIISEMKDTMRDEVKKIEAQVKEIEKTITQDMIAPLLKTQKFKVARQYGSRETYELNFNYDDDDDDGYYRGNIKPEDLPAKLLKTLREINALNQQKEEIEVKLRELDGKKTDVRNKILRSMLEGTPQGQRFLGYLAEIKGRIPKNLLTGKK